MSLINKMLQDLDARGSPSGPALQAEIKPVMVAEPRLPVRQIILGATVVIVAVAAGALWWWKRQAVAVPPPRPLAMVAVPVATAPAAAPAAKRQRRALAPPGESAAVPVQAPQPAPAAVPAAPVGQETIAAATTARARGAAARPAASVTASTPAVAAQRASAPPAAPANPGGGRSMTDAQRSERLYREAMVMLDEGRVSAAIDGLAQTLKLNPRHDGARQNLVSLLVEAGRKDEAIAQLELGLAADSAQPQMAMLLARMQIERGQSGVATLLRSLPSAQGNADYHAFLAGALQREGRHAEAVEHYRLALGANPGQGVWLMGMGISLQAEGRQADARAAFDGARASGMLSAPLREFVERKLQQLAR